MEMDTLDPYDASDISFAENRGLKMFPSTQDHCGISSASSIRHGRNAFVDYFDEDCKETQKNNWRSSVSCESGR